MLKSEENIEQFEIESRPEFLVEDQPWASGFLSELSASSMLAGSRKGENRSQQESHTFACAQLGMQTDRYLREVRAVVPHGK